MPQIYIGSQTASDKIRSRKGNKPRPPIKVPKYVRWKRMWNCIDELWMLARSSHTISKSAWPAHQSSDPAPKMPTGLNTLLKWMYRKAWLHGEESVAPRICGYKPDPYTRGVLSSGRMLGV